MGEQLYEIVEGVRRAKAAWRCGHETITARLDELGEVMQAPLSSLLSPKPLIEDNGPRGGSWGVIYRMTQRGDYLPPSIITPGNFGTPIADVEVAEDELELFRQRYSSDP
jgi:hypothetical protein